MFPVSIWIFKSLLCKISLQKSDCKKLTRFMFSFVNPNFLTKESNFEITPPVKNSNSNVISSFSSLPTFLTNSSIFSILSLKASEVFSIVLSTSGKIFCNCWDNCCWPVGGKTVCLGVREIVLFFFISNFSNGSWKIIDDWSGWERSYGW